MPGNLASERHALSHAVHERHVLAGYHKVKGGAPHYLVQVLGNAELRARYDAHGAEALDVNFMDSAEFFTALFGSDRFDHLVGELMIAVAARSGGDFHPGQMKKLQARTHAHNSRHYNSL